MAINNKVVQAPGIAAAVPTGGKTKAKQRYLKKKKERRKHRKAATATSASGSTSKLPVDESISEESEKGDDWEDEGGETVTNKAAGGMEVDEVLGGNSMKKRSSNKKDSRRKVQDGKAISEVESRPRKKRKVAEDDDENEGHGASSEGDANPQLEAPVIVLPDDGKEETPHIEPTTRSKLSSPPPGALPSFPLPTRPDAPSKLDLALQGLDQALVNAEIVNPATTLKIDSDGDRDELSGLSTRMRHRLRDLGITELFAVQTALLPFLLPSQQSQRAIYQPYSPPQDACVSAPTGSGKTLAYVIPIVELLSTRIVTRLRALIVLPTRDLVSQVQETLEAIGKGRGLKIGTATGQHSFAHEQAQLVPERNTRLHGGSSAVDILICTPGRLIDHLNGTPNFSLQHLRFLVIDEADRLLAQSFQNWLAQVLTAVRPPPSLVASNSSLYPEWVSHNGDVPYHDAVAPAWAPRGVPTSLDNEPRTPSCQKLLFSATLTSDPGKLKALDLHEPRYFIVRARNDESDEGNVALESLAMEKFSMPENLSEHMIVCEAQNKPLVLFYLVCTRGVRSGALVFTKSTESAIRLVQLFEYFFANSGVTKKLADGMNVDGAINHVPVVRAYSSDLPAGERKAILEKFKAREVDILVCSDLVSRGIDISHVENVVSYDAPVDMRKYVHRVGRTARAGRAGNAWTLIEEQEARHFKEFLRSAEHIERVKRIRVSDKDLSPFAPAYEQALLLMKEKYSRA